MYRLHNLNEVLKNSNSHISGSSRSTCLMHKTNISANCSLYRSNYSHYLIFLTVIFQRCKQYCKIAWLSVSRLSKYVAGSKIEG
jgi:hypothetical protein